MPGSPVSSLDALGATALLTAACRALESRRADSAFRDPTAEAQLQRLSPVLATSSDRLHRRIAGGRIRAGLVSMVALRAWRFDAWVREFARAHPGGTVVSLGCGIDDRLGRMGDVDLSIVSLDRPRVLDVRASMVPSHPREWALPARVEKSGWMEEVRSRARGALFVVAEGLFMYLTPEDVRGLVRGLAHRLRPVGMAFDTLHARWLRPPLRRAMEQKMHRQLGIGPDARIRFGMADARALELPGTGWRLAEEWSHLDEPGVRPRSLRLFRRWEWIRRVQWSLRYVR